MTGNELKILAQSLSNVEFAELLEHRIDKDNISSILGLLSGVVDGKADFILENHQDDRLAFQWKFASEKIDRLIYLLESKGL